MRVWRRVEEAGPRVALTFDDCDDPESWRRILDSLAARGARATFFPNGFRAGPDLAGRTVVEGHSVGSHGWDHHRLPDLPREEVRRRFAADRELWERIAGVSLRLMRPPMGEYDEGVLEEAAAAGYTDMALWDVDPADWRDRDAGLIVDRVMGAAREGSIVELHVLEATADAVPALLEGLWDLGLEPASLDMLLRSKPNER